MVASSKKSSLLGRHKTLIDRLDYLLGKREEYLATINAADALRAERLKEATKEIEQQWQDEVGSAPFRLRVIEANMAAFLQKSHHNLTRRYKKTIKRELGEVKVVERAKELEIPGSEKAVVDFLLKRMGGKRYITYTPKLNRKALLLAPSALLSLLAPLGVWRGQHRLISVHSPSEVALKSPAKTISYKRLNDRNKK